MTTKAPKLDKTTAAIAKRLMELPPKPHDDMKVGRPAANKEGDPKGRASSSKPPNA